MEENIKKFLSDLDKEESTINLYTINKKPQRKDLEKKYIINFATIKGNSKDYILKTIKEFLKNNINKIKENKNYFDFNINNWDYYLSISAEKVKEFDFVHNRMKAKQRLPSLKNLTDKTTCLVIEVIINGEQYLLFQKINISPKIKRKFTSIVFKNGVFDKILEPRTEALEFPPYFSFMYLNKLKNFLIFNKIKFEQSFDFRKFYEKNSKEAIKKLETKKFVFSKELKEDLLTKPTYTVKFTKLLLCNGLDDLEKRDLTPYEKEFGIKMVKDSNGNITINNSEDLDSLIKILQKECVIEVSTREKFFSKSKVKALIDKVGGIFK